MTGKKQAGYVLGMVMIFFIIFTILGLSFIKMAGYEQIHAANYLLKTKAFYQAEAGIHTGMWRLNHVSKAAATFTDSTISVAFDSTTNKMVAVGTAGTVQDSIQVTIFEDVTFKFQTWKEL